MNERRFLKLFVICSLSAIATYAQTEEDDADVTEPPEPDLDPHAYPKVKMVLAMVDDQREVNPSRILVPPGSTVELHCEVETYDAALMAWFKPDFVPVKASSYLLPTSLISRRKTRYVVQPEGAPSEICAHNVAESASLSRCVYKLLIKEFAITDAGEFSCYAINPGQELTPSRGTSILVALDDDCRPSQVRLPEEISNEGAIQENVKGTPKTAKKKRAAPVVDGKKEGGCLQANWSLTAHSERLGQSKKFVLECIARIRSGDANRLKMWWSLGQNVKSCSSLETAEIVEDGGCDLAKKPVECYLRMELQVLKPTFYGTYICKAQFGEDSYHRQRVPLEVRGGRGEPSEQVPQATNKQAQGAKNVKNASSKATPPAGAQKLSTTTNTVGNQSKENATESRHKRSTSEVREQGGRSPGCFPGSARVVSRSRGSVPMAELQVGEEIETDGGFSKFIAHLHADAESESRFVRVSTCSGREVEVSEEHVVYVLASGVRHAVYARQVTVGDVMVADGHTITTVTNITSITARGRYAPLTSAGTVMVEGLLMSCYAHVPPSSLTMVHNIFYPWRMMNVVTTSINHSFKTFLHVLVENSNAFAFSTNFH